jgi:hypothetical protein
LVIECRRVSREDKHALGEADEGPWRRSVRSDPLRGQGIAPGD